MTRPVDALERLAGSAMPREQFQWAAATELRKLVGFDSMSWGLTDPSTWVHSWTVADNEVILREQRRLHPLWLRSGEIPDLMRAGYAPARRTVAGARRSRSYWWELAEPAGLADGLSIALVDDDACWGLLHIYRDHDGRPFTGEDARTLLGVAPLLADRMRRSTIEPRLRTAPATESGTVVLGAGLELVATTDTAARWLTRLPQAAPGGDPLPGFVYALAARGVGAGADGPRDDLAHRLPARLRIEASDGTWLSVHAAELSPSTALGDGAVAVTIEPARSVLMRSLMMRAHHLSQREREVASLVITGFSNPEVASALFISRNTVSDHLKAIYHKAGVSSRAGLAAVLAGAGGRRDGADGGPGTSRGTG
jgi:DNA-binding CsgD family transcriptional regulator